MRILLPKGGLLQTLTPKAYHESNCRFAMSDMVARVLELTATMNFGKTGVWVMKRI